MRNALIEQVHAQAHLFEFVIALGHVKRTERLDVHGIHPRRAHPFVLIPHKDKMFFLAMPIDREQQEAAEPQVQQRKPVEDSHKGKSRL